MKLTNQCQKLLLALVIFTSALSLAKSPRVNYARVKAKGTLYYKTSQDLTEKEPVELKPEDSLYLDLFAKNDSRIENLYRDQWWYHDAQVATSTHWEGEHIAFASLDARPEIQVREEFARQVFRMRVDQGIRDYLKQANAPKAVQRAQAAMDRVKNVPLRLGGPGSRAGEFRIGYDLTTDSSKVEYVGGYLEAGFYQNAAANHLGNLRHGDFQVSTNLGADVPKAAVKVPATREIYEASLSANLSPVIAASLSSQQPLERTDAPQQYYAQIAYHF